MPDSVFFALTLASAVSAGLMAGIYFAFSSMVMPGLRRLQPGEAVRSMQSIDVALLNAWFLSAFVGSAVLSGISVVFAFVRWGEEEAIYLLIAGLLLIFGSLVLTGAYHIPRNKALHLVDPESPEAKERWETYDAEWTSWNHVRAVASLASAILFAAGLATVQ
ncbi:anthrone oxygenase family protein [Jiangella endophytica]|uniref:anthrone oxygenase family protein n=1 Tax=Jiangella endophytica TaxID=1623398 RepID=UPI000E34F6F9|nr:anthrone oxygenase family protein [Jiangella endophytica]